MPRPVAPLWSSDKKVSLPQWEEGKRDAQRVALGEKTAGRVDDPLAAKGVVLLVDELVRLAGGGQAERIVEEELAGVAHRVRRCSVNRQMGGVLCGEAVVELDDLDVGRLDAGLFVDLLGGQAGHVGARELDGRLLREELGRVGRHGLGDDLDGLVVELVPVDKVARGDDGAGATVRGRAAHGPGQLRDQRIT